MALPDIPVPKYPNVPQAPGVPPVARDGSAVQAPSPQPLKGDDVAAAVALGPKWGIFTPSGDVALDPDSFISMGFQKEWRIPDYPMEDGAFQSYNKVTRPFEIRVAMSKGGTVAARNDFINQVNAFAETLQLLNVVTPEQTYLNANIMHVSYDRSQSSGAGMINVELTFVEIRNTVVVSFSNVQTASASSPVNNGNVQTQPLTVNQQAAVTSASPTIAGGG